MSKNEEIKILQYIEQLMKENDTKKVSEVITEYKNNNISGGKNNKIIEILNRIDIAIERGSLDVAKDYVKLELDNLQGITQHRCQNTKYYFR